ncbi:MAG: hypothetical protein AABW85_03450 [archaeon]
MAKGEWMKKGLVFSISTVLVASFILLFAAFYAQKVQAEENSVYKNFETEKAGFVAEDITGDINSILGTQIDANRSQTNLAISFFDQLPPKTAKNELTDYNAFVFGTYSVQQNAKISMNIDRLADGKTELLFSNGPQYDFDYSGTQNSASFYRQGTDTGTTGYDINVFVSGAKLASTNSFGWSCFASGTDVKLHFEDSFGNTIDSSCKHNPNILDQYIILFENKTGQITVNFGSVSSNPNAVKIQNTLQDTSVTAATAIKATMPAPAQEISWQYDADLNYSQGDTNISRKIELGRS